MTDISHPVHEPASKVRLRLWLKLLKVTRMVEADVRDQLRVRYHSTLPRFDVMAALDRFDNGLRMTELSSVLKVSNGNVTGIVDRLVTDGMVERVPVAGDRRAMTVRLTENGIKEFSALAHAHEGWVDDLLSPVCVAEGTELTAQLEKIVSHLERRTETS